MIGLLGGSFDPVHHGHLIVGQVAREALGLEALWFVPARQQPFKGGRHGASAEHRAAMLVLALADAPGLAVELTELDRPGPSYTVDTLQSFASGSPAASSPSCWAPMRRPSWTPGTGPGRSPGLARVIVFARPGSAVPASPLITGVIEVPAIDISATEIRRRVREGLPIRYWVPDSVAGYISRHRLYLDPA